MRSYLSKRNLCIFWILSSGWDLGFGTKIKMETFPGALAPSKVPNPDINLRLKPSVA
nr:MAG TPA: hypothetical protein [Caudoviricetes sp.]